MNYFLYYFKIFVISFIFDFITCTKDLTASSETLLWRPLVNKVIEGVSMAEEAFILVPADYEDKDSPFIPVNIRRFHKQLKTHVIFPVNVWYVPGGPGQSSKSLELMLPAFMKELPEGSAVYIVEHRGLGKSTPLANAEDKALLEKYPTDPKLLQEILKNKQRKLGILTPIIRALRVENVARDLLKGVSLVKKENATRKNYLFGVSYGTMISRRALQIAPDGTFEAALLDGLAPVERIEFSNESDRIIEEFCNLLPECKRQIDGVTPRSAVIKVREIIPEILKNQNNSCASYFFNLMQGRSLCWSLHDLLNSTLLQGRAKVKVATLRLLFEMVSCRDPEGFKVLADKVNSYLMNIKAVNQLQSAAVVLSSENTAPKVSSAAALDPQKALSADELVFDVVSALERYDVTDNSINICYNVKHTTNGDDRSTCPARLFDPCVFFQMTYERKMALMDVNGVLPPISLQEPMVNLAKTRVMILAGNLDFNTPTWLSRQLAFSFTRGLSVKYHEFFGYGHAMFGSSDCDKELMADFLTGSDSASSCALKWNMKNAWIINGYFRMSLIELSNTI